MGQIHELNLKALSGPAYIAVDDGSDTYRVDLSEILFDLADQSLVPTFADIATTTKIMTFYNAEGDVLFQIDLKPVFQGIQNQIGDLDDLETENKSDLVSAINEATISGGNVEIYVDGTSLVINTDLTNGNEVSY